LGTLDVDRKGSRETVVLRHATRKEANRPVEEMFRSSPSLSECSRGRAHLLLLLFKLVSASPTGSVPGARTVPATREPLPWRSAPPFRSCDPAAALGARCGESVITQAPRPEPHKRQLVDRRIANQG